MSGALALVRAGTFLVVFVVLLPAMAAGMIVGAITISFQAGYTLARRSL